MTCERILLATGARERFMPFEGWTLPGVWHPAPSRSHQAVGVLPARETLVAGAGLFLTAVARDIQKSGGRVPALLIKTSFFGRCLPSPSGPAVHQVRSGRRPARQAAAFRNCRAQHHPHPCGPGGQDPARSFGRPRRQQWQIVPGSETIYRTGCLAAGFGFTANVELAQLAGCGLSFNSQLGGWVVHVNGQFETGVAGIHAAGEITAVGGAAKSMAEGRLAGYGILQQMGLLKPGELYAEICALNKIRQHQMAFARYFNSQYTFPQEYMACWIRSLPDEVPVCRCEGVSLGDIRRAVAEGSTRRLA